MADDQIKAFLKAALNNDVQTIQKFLAGGFDVNAQDEQGISALLIAAYAGHIEVVKLLLAREDIDVEGSYIDTPLVKAVQEGHQDIVQRLIDTGADVSILNRDGFTVLQTKWHNHILNLVNKTGLTPDPLGLCYGGAATALFAAVRGEAAAKIFIESVNASNEMTVEKMKAFETYLLSMPEPRSEIKQHPDYQPYMDTMALLQNIVVNFMASNYAHLLPADTPVNGQLTETASAALFQPDSKGQVESMKNTMVAVTPELYATYTAETLEENIDKFITQCQQENEPRGIILCNEEHAISCSYDPRNQKWLLFDMNKQPIYKQLSAGDVAQFIWVSLEENNPNFEISTRIISSGYLATKQKLQAHMAKKNEDRLSFSFTGASQETLNKSLIKAVSYESLPYIDLFAGSNVSSKTLSDCLFTAIAREKPDIIRILLAHHANVQAKNNQGETPFAYAKLACNQAVYDALIEGAMHSPSWPNFFNELVVDGDIDFILHAIKQPGFDPNQPDVNGNTPLHMLASSRLNHSRLTQALEAMQARGELNPYMKNNSGKTAIDLVRKEKQYRVTMFEGAGITKFKAEIIDKGQHLQHTGSPLLTAYAPSQAVKEERVQTTPPKPKGT